MFPFFRTTLICYQVYFTVPIYFFIAFVVDTYHAFKNKDSEEVFLTCWLEFDTELVVLKRALKSFFTIVLSRSHTTDTYERPSTDSFEQSPTNANRQFTDEGRKTCSYLWILVNNISEIERDLAQNGCTISSLDSLLCSFL